MKPIFSAALSSFALLTASAASAQAPVMAVDSLNIPEYLGTWYEIASFPQIFQAGCVCTTANYSLNSNGTVKVDNACRLRSPDGISISATGQARVPNPDQPGELRVKFFRLFEADYWVLTVADDYSYAMVGSPNRKTLWILSRTPTLDPVVYQDLLEDAAAAGFDLDKLRITRQDGCWADEQP